MNKKVFLEQLEQALSKISAEERGEILRDYEEHFFSAQQAGKSEEETAQALGDPQTIARAYYSESLVNKMESALPLQHKILPMLRSYILVVGLGFVNLMVFGIPYFIAGVILISFWISSLTFAFHSIYNCIVTLFYIVTHFNPHFVMSFFAELGNVFLSVILLVFVHILTEIAVKIFIKHIRICLKISGIKT